MPKKPKPQNSKISIAVNGFPIDVTLYSPRGKKKTWYAYWNGLTSARTTNQTNYEEAVKAVTAMLNNGGKRPDHSQSILSNEEFEQIQRRHFSKKTDPTSVNRSQKSLTACLEAIEAFKKITGITNITTATADDCERFQHEALRISKHWRRPNFDPHNETRSSDLLKPDTILKWSTALQAAFNRVNSNAGKKCVRGVVPEHKLLKENPWLKFTWIEGRIPTIRQFDEEELLSLINYFETNFPKIPISSLFVKVCLWTYSRRIEVSSLRWDSLRRIGENEFHFEIVGKWGVEKWARIPTSLYNGLVSIKTDNTYVFGDYPNQLREHHLSLGSSRSAHQVVNDFNPTNLGDWMYRRLKEWEGEFGKESAYLHIFRKTTLQYAQSGQSNNEEVASDAHLGSKVMMTHYTKAIDLERRDQSNRTYQRILNALPNNVAKIYGHQVSDQEKIIEDLDRARRAGNWEEVGKLAQKLEALDKRNRV